MNWLNSTGTIDIAKMTFGALSSAWSSLLSVDHNKIRLRSTISAESSYLLTPHRLSVDITNYATGMRLGNWRIGPIVSSYVLVIVNRI